jgi:RNA polymerase sigma factor (sigma-70 family)
MRLEHTQTRIDTRQDVAAQYENARRQLARALAELSHELAAGELEHERAAALAAQRGAVIEQGLRFFGPLRRFVRHEAELWADPVALDSGQLPIDDIIASIYLSAVDEADSAPSARAFYTWLRRIARREVRLVILEQQRLQRRELSLETPVAVVGEWPDHALTLIATLADPNAVLPEDVLEQREARRVMNTMLAKLPERWREVFLLSAVDGWPEDEVAAAEGIDPGAVRSIVAATRAFLRDWLRDDPRFAAA